MQFRNAATNASTNANTDTTTNQQGAEGTGGAVMPTFPHNRVLIGTNVLNQGWKSPATLSITLHGNTTLNDANFISVQVLPSSQAR